MTPRKAAPTRAPGPLDGLTCEVTVERMGARVTVPNVPCPAAFAVLQTLLEGFRVAAAHYEELVPGPDTVPGGTLPVDTSEIEGRLGFR